VFVVRIFMKFQEILLLVMTETYSNKKENTSCYPSWSSAYSSFTNNTHSVNEVTSKYFCIAPDRNYALLSPGQYQTLQPKVWPNLTVSHKMFQAFMINKSFNVLVCQHILLWNPMLLCQVLDVLIFYLLYLTDFYITKIVFLKFKFIAISCNIWDL
jgi:hypothetical protein